MGKGESEVWDEKHPDTRQTQPPRFEQPPRPEETGTKRSSCPTCCLKTRDCLMSPECGRALQISSVVAMCGTCIRMFVCKCEARRATSRGSRFVLTLPVLLHLSSIAERTLISRTRFPEPQHPPAPAYLLLTQVAASVET